MSWQGGPHALGHHCRLLYAGARASLRSSSVHQAAFLRAGELCLAGGCVFASGSVAKRSRGQFGMVKYHYMRSAANAVVSLNVVLYGLQIVSSDRLTVAFMKIGEAILRKGQWWRLGTCCVVHGNLAHLLINMQSLYNLGDSLEAYSGGRRFLVIYAVSGIASSLASLLLTPKPSLGASGAIMGLAGAQLVFHLRHRGHFEERMNRQLDAGAQSMLMSLALTLGFGLRNRQLIDNWAHAGGFVSGALAAWLLGPAFNQHGKRMKDTPPWPVLAHKPACFLKATHQAVTACSDDCE